MTDEQELLNALERLAHKVGQVLAALERLEAELGRWRAILPDPNSIKGRLGRRRVASALDMLDDGPT